MSNQTPNHEEASNIASEFIYSLENLPNEVSHLLQEIKFKENRSQELQQEIDRDSSKYIRHSLRAANSSNAPSSPTSRAPSPKSSLLPAKIASSYAEIQSLAAEKCILAQRLIELITFTRSRLDSDLAKVRNLQGEVVEPQTVGKTSALVMNAAGDPLSAASRNPALQITESLRTALSMTSTPETRQVSSPTVATPTPTAGHVTKKRRLTSSTLKVSPSPSIKGRSASPTTAGASGVHTTHQRSRLSRQIHPTEVEEDSMDADGDEDAEGEDGDGEDERLYCICQKQSYGDMIACDNEGGCPYEWFHLSCVGMKQPVPEKWYCPDCRSKGIGSTTVRKGRKK